MKIITNKLKFSCFIFFLLLIHSISFCQKVNNENEIIARVQNIPITKKEFIERYEFSPHAQTETAFDTSTMKREFLYTLIAEKLLAQKALQEKLDKTEEFEYLMQYLQNIYLRDALYKKEIKEKIKISDSSTTVAKKRMLKNLKIKFIFSEDKDDIDKIFNLLQSGASFDSILALRPESKEQNNFAEVTFGNLAPEIEEQIFDLLPGEFTKPVKLKEGWYICKVYDVTLKSELNSKDISKIKKIIEERAENKLYEEFYNNFFKGVIVNVDRQLFDKLVNHILEFINNNQKYFSEQKNNKLRFAELEFNQIQKFFSEKELNLPFVKFEISPITLKIFLKYSGYTGIEFDSPEISKIQKRLNAYISNFIKNELYSREAKKRGYDKLPEILEELQMWRDYYLSRAMMKKIFKMQHVSDKEAEEFYLKMNRTISYPDSVNIAEITSLSLEIIENILDELKNGSTFEQLQKKHESEKLTGLKPISELGEIGLIAADMKIGDIYGPIKTQEGYSIIKLLDKKEGKRKRIETFEEAKDDIKNILQTKKMYRELDKITAKLAIENGIKINESALKSIKVSNINILVFRRFGFGGQLIAVPYAPIYSSWFKIYQQLRKELTF